MPESATSEVITVLASRRHVCDGGEFLAAWFAWPGFTDSEREQAWDRWQDAVESGDGPAIAATRRYLLSGPAS